MSWPWAAAFLVAAVLAGYGVWRRSKTAVARRLARRVRELQPSEMPSFFDREILRYLPPEGPDALELAARHLEREGGDRKDLAALMSSTAMLVRSTPSGIRAGIEPGTFDPGPPSSAEDRLALAEAFHVHAQALTVLGKRSPEFEEVFRTFALQDWLFAAMLRAEGPRHLAALSDDVEELCQWASRTATIEPAALELYFELREIVRVLDQLARLPGAEDRALFLGQALTRLLSVQEGLKRHGDGGISFGTQVVYPALESIRQLLATSLRDIRQRAQLSLVLRSRVLTAERQAVLVLDLRNDGQGHAENITIEARGPEGSLRVIEPRQYVKRLLRDQSARVEFAVEARASDRVRVSFSITYDDLERQGQVRELADVVELRRERKPQEFRLLRPNPYVVGRPLTEEDVFIGRADIFERLDASLHGAHQDNVVVLIGQRRMGKTSILRRLGPHLGDSYLPVLIDLQGMLGRGEAPFLHEIAVTICDELNEVGLAIDDPDYASFQADPGSAFRRGFLRQACRLLGDRRLLLVFDEFEVLEERIAGGDLDRKVLPYFRSLMQHERQVSFIFAGTHRLEELTGDYWGVLFNLAVYLQVGHLPEQEVERLFVEPTEGYFEIDPLALEKTWRITGGHPHFSQLLARGLVEHRNREQLSYVTVGEIGTIASQVVEQQQLHITYLWDEASRSERLLLLAIAALLEQDGTATLATAHRYLVGRRIEPGDLPAAGRSLVGREILVESGGQLRFRMELLRRWLERHRDLESMMLSEPGGFQREPTRETPRPERFDE
ncbi:MAG: AAA family ATPase [Acidobacteriota bacterium]